MKNKKSNKIKKAKSSTKPKSTCQIPSDVCSNNVANETIQLESLVGLRELTGVDFDEETITGEYSVENCRTISFTLDNKTYTAYEDLEDGYRSCMRYLKISEKPTKNSFASVKVMARMRDEEVFQLLDIKTGKVVLEVGTDRFDSYYPSFVSNFSPENMACNN